MFWTTAPLAQGTVEGAASRGGKEGVNTVDRSKNIFRVGASHPLEEPALAESIVATNRSSAGSDFLLNGLPWRICVLSDAGHDNLIKPVVNIARGYQIPHSRLQGFVPHPVLNRSHIEARTEHASGIGRTEMSLDQTSLS